MKLDNKRVNKILIISNVLFAVLVLAITNVNYKNHMNYITAEKNLTASKNKLKNYNSEIRDLSKEINTKASDNPAEINEVSTEFLNAFLNYDALSKNKIYDNIKPYTTAYLINKLGGAKENELQSDVNYKVSIKNIRLYSKLIKDHNNASILVLADQEMQVNNSDTASPILVELKLSNIENKWLVDDLLINNPLKNTPFIN